MIRSVAFERFRKFITALPTSEHYAKTDLLREPFRLFADLGLDTYYVPFHRLNRHARVVLVGLTPGWTQMELAYRTARAALADGFSDEETFERVELVGSFSGSLRKNLVAMLDGIGINVWLSIASCAALFAESSHLVHFTSAVSAPIFRNAENYTV